MRVFKARLQIDTVRRADMAAHPYNRTSPVASPLQTNGYGVAGGANAPPPFARFPSAPTSTLA